jgi:polysaccharide biosynthesis/export protein
LMMAMSLIALAGCHGSNHYFAENSIFGKRLPDSMRLAARANPQTVDLSRLASASGGSETIGVGDVIEVKIAAGLSIEDQYTLSARVADDGTISLQEIGVIDVAGIEPQAAESLIKTASIQRQLYQNPSVTVEIKHQKMNKIKVLGAVKEPGIYHLSPGQSDLVAAIAAAGGLSEEAGEKVEIRNPASTRPVDRPAVADAANGEISNVSNTRVAGGMTSYSVNLISAAREGDGQYLVQDGGVINVEKVDLEPVFVQGLVKVPNRYKFEPGKDMYLLDAISLAGGMSNQLADKIYVVRRQVGQRDPVVTQVSYRNAKRSADSNLRLGPGDVITVEHTPATVLMEALNIIRVGVSGTTALF